MAYPQAALREQETQAAIEDAEIKGLEMQAQKEMLQQVGEQRSSSCSPFFLPLCIVCLFSFFDFYLLLPRLSVVLFHISKPH